jgi:tetratricopeptide (TPR) repeat protein
MLVLALLSGLIIVVASACHRDAEQSLTRAVEAWDSGNYKTAAEEYERYLYQRPTGDKAPEARFQLANIYYFKLQRYDQARANYSAFIEQNPSNANAQLARERLAEVLAEMGRSYEAIAEYENLNPPDASERRRIRLRIADLYFAQRNYSQALTEYDKVIEKAPYDELSEQAYLREASVYHLERSHYQQALPIYEKLASMTADPKVRLRAAYARAECYAGLYQFDEAIKTLRSIKDEPEQADVSRRVAELELQRQEAARARNGFEATANKLEKPRPDTAAAIKTETPAPVTTEKPAAAKPDNIKPDNTKKAENAGLAKTENTNKNLRSRSRKTDNAQPENSNNTGRNKSRKADNAQQGNSNTGKKSRSKKIEDAQPVNSNVVKKVKAKSTDGAQSGNTNAPKRRTRNATNSN